MWAASAAKGGMVMTIEFEYDEHVAVVMAAFRERTRTPHASMPSVHRVDVLRERLCDAEDDTKGWHTRKRRFFTHNDAPEWIRGISGGEYLVGIERLEWNDREGRMRMYTVNESHANMIIAEELCVFKKHPEFPNSKTVKTLTVRARLRVRGWWTLGLSNVAERFLLRQYERLVRRGKRIELDEIARWRASGRADRLLANGLRPSAPGRAEEKKRRSAVTLGEATGTDASFLEGGGREDDSPVSTLREGRVDVPADQSSPATVDGLEVETFEAFEKSFQTALPSTPGSDFSLGPDEDQWLVMRYEDGFRTPVRDEREATNATETLPGIPAARPPADENEAESPLYVPLEEVEEADASEAGLEQTDDDATFADADGSDDGIWDSRIGTPGATARLCLSPADASDERRVRVSASRRESSIRKKKLSGALESWGDLEAEIVRKLGLETETERFERRSLLWRRAAVRAAMCCAAAAVAHERRQSFAPVAEKFRRVAIAAKRRVSGRGGKAKGVER